MRHLKILGQIGLALIISSCADKPKSDTNDNKEAPVDKLEKISFEDSYAAQPVNVDNLAVDFADFEIRKDPFENKYTEGQVDTVMILTKQTDTLYLYKTPKNLFLYAVRINSKRIRLDKNIGLGMSRDEFYKVFKQLDTVRDKKNFITIWTMGSSIDFQFTADTLSRIKVEFDSVD